MGKIINLFGNDTNITLSNGTAVDMYSETIEEAFEAFDNLLSSIVLEQFKDIVKISVDEGNYDAAVEILKKEVHHVVESQLINHREALEWILSTLVLQRLDYFISEINKKQQKEDE